VFIYPRIASDVAAALYDSLLDRDVVDLRRHADIMHPAAGFYAIGNRVPQERLKQLQAAVRSIVDRLGFPEPKRRQEAFSQFDHDLPKLLCESMQIVPADAAAEGVWSFIGLVLLPDIAAWRYPNRSRERMIGLPRNAFRRLWWRGFVLGHSPHDAPAVLGEDQLVAVMERPTIGGNARLARAFCKIVTEAQIAHPGLSPMFIMRESAKRLMRFTPFICTDALSDEALMSLLDEVVGNAVESLQLQDSSAD
jgi:hypothetical protein